MLRGIIISVAKYQIFPLVNLLMAQGTNLNMTLSFRDLAIFVSVWIHNRYHQYHLSIPRTTVNTCLTAFPYHRAQTQAALLHHQMKALSVLMTQHWTLLAVDPIMVSMTKVNWTWTFRALVIPMSRLTNSHYHYHHSTSLASSPITLCLVIIIQIQGNESTRRYFIRSSCARRKPKYVYH